MGLFTKRGELMGLEGNVDDEIQNYLVAKSFPKLFFLTMNSYFPFSVPADEKNGGEYQSVYPGYPGAVAVASPVPDAAYLPQARSKEEQKKIQSANVVAVPQQAQLVKTQREQQQQPGFSNMYSTDPLLTRDPMMMRSCPHCHQESRTRVKTSPSWQTWASSGVLLIAFWPICWIPLVMDNCKQTDHYCVMCGRQVGSVEPFQDCCVTNRA